MNKSRKPPLPSEVVRICY